MTGPVTRRAFLGVLGVAALPAARPTALRRRVVIPAGFSGGLTSGFATRAVRGYVTG